MQTTTHPRRADDLVLERLGDELLVFDKGAKVAHALPGDVAAVFHHCDGSRSRAEIAALTDLPEARVEQALEELRRCALLEGNGVSRREFARRVAVAGSAAAAAGLGIRSLVAPEAADAQSPGPPDDDEDEEEDGGDREDEEDGGGDDGDDD